MVDGDIQDAESPHLVRSPSDALELLVASTTPNRQLPYLDVLALSAANISSSAWNFDVKKKAKAIYDQAIWIRGLFGALDGLIISYSTFKYIFDYITPADIASSDAMHDWMVTGAGAFGACSASLAIITLSLIGNIFDDEHKNPLIRSMAMIWPYVRDGFKGLKFAYKGVRSTIQIAQLMGVNNLGSMIFPLGLVLGVAAAANRIWYRNQITEKRKEYQKNNNVLLNRAQNLGMNCHYDLLDGTGVADDALQPQTLYLEINQANGLLEYKVKNPLGEIVQGKLSLENDLHFNGLNPQGEAIALTLDSLNTYFREQILIATSNNGHTAAPNTADNRAAIRRAIKDDSLLPNRNVVIASALFGGFIDGLYTYMGAMGIAILSPQLFVVMLACCVIFTVICIINRYYEEDQFQNEFLRSAKNVELVLAAKDIEDSFSRWQALSKLNARNSRQVKLDQDQGLTDSAAIRMSQSLDEESKAIDKLLHDIQLPAFEVIQEEYDAIYTVTTGRAILIGLRSGVYFYSAVSSIIFAYAAFCTTFPPALLVTAITIGIVSLIAFAIHAVIVNDEHTAKVNDNKRIRQREIKLADYVDEIKETFRIGQEIIPASIAERDALMDGMPMGPVPQLDYQPALEIIRSCCSGLPKGNKGLDFVGEYWLEPDSQGHYQETSWMMSLGVVFSIFYSIVYALRAFGKGFRGANDVPLPTLPRLDLQSETSGASSPANSDFNDAPPSPVSSFDASSGASAEQSFPHSLGLADPNLPSALSGDDIDRVTPLPITAAAGRPAFPVWSPRIFGAVNSIPSAVDLLHGDAADLSASGVGCP